MNVFNTRGKKGINILTVWKHSLLSLNEALLTDYESLQLEIFLSHQIKLITLMERILLHQQFELNVLWPNDAS